MTVAVPLTQGKVAIVDDEDADRVLAAGEWTAWWSGTRWYAARKVGVKRNQRTVFLHRFLLGLSPDDPQVDHVDGDGLNNQRSNLRLATDSQNHANMSKPKRAYPQSSRFKGVTLVRGKRWQAYIQVRGRRIHLGVFDTEEEAAAAYDAAAREHFGEFARTNKDAETARQLPPDAYVPSPRCGLPLTRGGHCGLPDHHAARCKKRVLARSIGGGS